MKDPRNITPAEFQIIEVLWGEDSAKSVSQVQSQLKTERPLAYTTVMTFLDKMARKGSVKRSKRGKAYYYQPAVGRSQVLSYLIQDFVNCYCDGQIRRLSVFLDGEVDRRPPASAPVRRQKVPKSSQSPDIPPSSNAGDEEMDIVLL